MASDLRPGQKVTVSYQNAEGVLVADHIVQQPIRYVGTVQAIDPPQHTLTVRHGAMDKEFQIADDCRVMFRDGKTGTLADLQPGYHVTVTYEMPNGKPTAWEIAQTSATFTGTLTAIDLDNRTVKAKAAFSSMKFNRADEFAIVLNGKTGGQMRDLRPGEELTFSYDDVDGVNVVNRIA
jgi:Cu/Ag efflux protein CusF